MGNWLSAEPGLSPADTVQIPSGQRDDNRRGGEEAEGKGRNRAAVEGYILNTELFFCHKFAAVCRNSVSVGFLPRLFFNPLRRRQDMNNR